MWLISISSCFLFSTLAYTFRRMSSGAIPASKYMSSSLGFKTSSDIFVCLVKLWVQVMCVH